MRRGRVLWLLALTPWPMLAVGRGSAAPPGAGTTDIDFVCLQEIT
jgi:hypothetical protein